MKSHIINDLILNNFLFKYNQKAKQTSPEINENDITVFCS